MKNLTKLLLSILCFIFITVSCDEVYDLPQSFSQRYFDHRFDVEINGEKLLLKTNENYNFEGFGFELGSYDVDLAFFLPDMTLDQNLSLGEFSLNALNLVYNHKSFGSRIHILPDSYLTIHFDEIEFDYFISGQVFMANGTDSVSLKFDNLSVARAVSLPSDITVKSGKAYILPGADSVILNYRCLDQRWASDNKIQVSSVLGGTGFSLAIYEVPISIGVYETDNFSGTLFYEDFSIANSNDPLKVQIETIESLTDNARRISGKIEGICKYNISQDLIQFDVPFSFVKYD